ncbi:MAG: hypothetical protein ACREBJ_09680, partial [Nitrosotalea sp.]
LQTSYGGYLASGIAISGNYLYGSETRTNYPIRYLGRVLASGDASGAWKSVQEVAPAFPSTVPQAISSSPETNNLADVVLIGKSLGGGTARTTTIVNGTASVTHTAHGYQVGDILVYAGATSAGSIGDFNQLHIITNVLTADAYQFKTTASTGAITGSPKELFWFKGTRSLNPMLIKNITRSAAGQYLVIFANTQPDIFWETLIYGTYSSNSMAVGIHSQTTSQFNCDFYQLNTASNPAIDPSIMMQITLAGIQ